MLNITNNTEDFKSEDHCIVYFTAEWCGPCKQLKPQYARLAVMNPETNYYMVDVDKVPSSTIQYYGIQSIPQVFVMQKGEIIQSIKSRTAENMLKEINK
ncbi:thioredoxin [uncultured Caudovirales phage]|uniref:Thioredoxin n=1 Tax=uncultured Caudovirales phage TaxID=2100421 RepID=A0A6J7WKB9_9CAUD|nr:thioredoxin [uncultured Caudovirales phage]